ncbi:MAG: DUF262 domain-containing protein [Alcaligenaceae bacterium]|nr:DUF262 domain-containing protein [Alcaligenaceae bacterium]
MTISNNSVSAISVGNLLAQNLQIPHYQRPYSWHPATALQLLDDIQQAMEDADRHDVPYVLGAVILHDTGSNIDVKVSGLDVVDGQQRLITLQTILDLLSETYNDHTTRDHPDNPIGRVQTALCRQIQVLSKEQRTELTRFIRQKCEFIRIVTDDIDEAFRVFDSQNYRGKPLAPHDLLKAYHLREMRDETAAMKTAVVEAWESVSDKELDRLFSTYLYRIKRWSRGESAPNFTLHDIDMFKGVSPKINRSPSARYHISAQFVLPALSACGAFASGLVDRDTNRSRFQIDAPVVAGRPFFEMVSFMLSEIRQLASEVFTGERGKFSLYHLHAQQEDNTLLERPSRSRYRYVFELFMAAFLYYTNKFGNEGLTAAREQLFAWAYTPRVELLRVQFRSIDNRARGDQSVDSAFALIRHAESGRVVRQLSASFKPYNDTHEQELVALLNNPEA